MFARYEGMWMFSSATQAGAWVKESVFPIDSDIRSSNTFESCSGVVWWVALAFGRRGREENEQQEK